MEKNEAQIDMHLILNILNMFPYNFIEKLSKIALNKRIAKYASKRKPLIDKKIFLKVFKFKDTKDEIFSLVNTISSMKYRYSSGHYGKIKLWDFEGETTSVGLQKLVPFNVNYSEKNNLVICYGAISTIFIVSLELGKLRHTIELDFNCLCIVLIEDKTFSDQLAFFIGPTLSKVTINSKEASLEEFDSEIKIYDLLNFNNQYIVGLTGDGYIIIYKDGKRVNSSLKSEKIFSIVQLNRFIALEMYDQAIKIVTLPDLIYYKSIGIPIGGKLMNLGINLGEDILYNMNLKEGLCNFIFPHWESKYGLKSYCSVKIPDKISKREVYNKFSPDKETILMYTKYHIYQISVFN